MSSSSSSFNPATPTPTSTDLSEKLEPLVASIDSGPVQAYAKLEGDDLCYYIRTMQVSLGRRVSKPDSVDIPLGNTKSVSRQHANLFYNFTNKRFEMIVHGKNGAFVNEQFIEKGVTVPLENKTKIQIGEMSFVFLLPRTTDGDLATTTNTRDNGFGYISTPRQLEKKSNKEMVVQSNMTELELDSNDGDSGSESSEAYHHNKDVKPPYSYASLIAQAINSSNKKKMTLNGIYNYITTHYPYYQMTQNGWQNSIRHNLSLNKAFIKVPRGDDEPGKGAFWTIDSTAETQFANGVYKRNKRATPLCNLNSSKTSDSDHIHQKKRLKRDEDDGGEEEENDDGNMDKEEEECVTMTTADEKETKSTDNMDLETSNDINAAVVTAAAAVAAVDSSENNVNELTTTDNSPNNNNDIQAQLQLQLQNTIRQHLLDPVRYPLPSSIAQLLPQAIAQLPPQLANQLSSTLKA
ncbi:hypothetical protein K501DRAFT_206650, partial [Backusella circina FSU 941]